MDWRTIKDKYKSKNRAKQVEKELPFALMGMAIELNIGIRFEDALHHIATEGYGILSQEIGKVHHEIIHNNAAVPEALREFGLRIPSRAVKRTVSQLCHIYEQGNQQGMGGESIKQLAHELLLLQKEESKKYSGKMVVFSLMFIAVSAIVPALFQAFIVVGSVFMSLDFTPIQILIIVAVLFPLVDIAVLLFIKNQKPAGVGG